jgi:hypothetical protein
VVATGIVGEEIEDGLDAHRLEAWGEFGPDRLEVGHGLRL